MLLLRVNLVTTLNSLVSHHHWCEVVAYGKNQYIKPNAGLTDQLSQKYVTFSANIRQIESKWFDFFSHVFHKKYNI